MTGYYTVRIENSGTSTFHTVYASSDYAAAIKVKSDTGCMAKNEKDVMFIPACTTKHHIYAATHVCP